MKYYEEYAQSPDGWNITSTLELGDDGQFCYDETWTDYTNVTTGVTVDGSWRREDGAVVLHPLRVEGTVGGWVVGRERKGSELGDTLDFGGRLTLRVPPERVQDVAVRNTGMKPLTVVLEPSGTRHALAPGERVRVVARGPVRRERLQVVRGAEEVLVYGWTGAQLEVVWEQQQIKPSPELAARIRRWVDELPTEGTQNWVGRLCKEHDSIPLHSTQIYLWALRPDGQVLSIDHESFARRAEPENDPVTAYAALAQGARAYPALGELLTQNPAGACQCEVCGGVGWTETQTPARGTDSCQRCYGMGWYAPHTPR